MQRILFVCSGNTCRSPMAEAIMNDLLGEAADAGRCVASSAGTFASEGAPISANARKALEALGIAADCHRARLLTAQMIDEADLILAMQSRHLGEITMRNPAAKGKAHTLKGYAKGVEGFVADGSCDIEDPYMGPYEVYAACADEIRQNLVKLIEKLRAEGAL